MKHTTKVERLGGDEDLDVFEYAVTLKYHDSKLILGVTGTKEQAYRFSAAGDLFEALEALVSEIEYDVQSELKSGRPVPIVLRDKLEAARSAMKKARGLS